MPCILWLDASHDDQVTDKVLHWKAQLCLLTQLPIEALGRICIGTKDVFLSSRNNQDSRLANGIILADIAAIRRGLFISHSLIL